MTEGPRLPPRPPHLWDEQAVEALRGAFPDRMIEAFRAGPAPNVVATMLHHPRLAGPFNRFGNVLLDEPAVGHRARELMLLRVAWRTRARYEWVHHVRLAAKYGVSAEDIEGITGRSLPGTWTALERDLLAATDELLDGYRITDRTWERLAAQLDERQLVEIPFVIGTYTCLAMAFNSWGLQVEEGLDMTGIPDFPDQ